MAYTPPQLGSVWYDKITGDQLTVDSIDTSHKWYNEVHFEWSDGTKAHTREHYWSALFTQTPPTGKTRTQYAVLYRDEDGMTYTGPVRKTEQSAVKAYHEYQGRRPSNTMLRVITRTVTETEWKTV